MVILTVAPNGRHFGWPNVKMLNELPTVHFAIYKTSIDFTAQSLFHPLVLRMFLQFIVLDANERSIESLATLMVMFKDKQIVCTEL